MAEKFRKEKDSMGEILVPADKYWGAQTERSFENFKIGIEKMPREVIKAFGYLKKSAAMANNKLGKLDNKKCKIICQVCDEIIAASWKVIFLWLYGRPAAERSPI